MPARRAPPSGVGRPSVGANPKNSPLQEAKERSNRGPGSQPAWTRCNSGYPSGPEISRRPPRDRAAALLPPRGPRLFRARWNYAPAVGLRFGPKALAERPKAASALGPVHGPPMSRPPRARAGALILIPGATRRHASPSPTNARSWLHPQGFQYREVVPSLYSRRSVVVPRTRNQVFRISTAVPRSLTMLLGRRT